MPEMWWRAPDAPFRQFAAASPRLGPSAGRDAPGRDLRAGRLPLGSRGSLPAPWWAWPLAIFALTRALNVLMVLAASSRQTADVDAIPGYHSVLPVPREPGYLDIASNWDGQWYADLALNGYPAAAPGAEPGPPRERGADAADQSAWAFSPLFPAAVRLFMALTHLPFTLVAPLLATACAAVGVALLHRLVQQTAGTGTARTTTLLLCTSMAAPALQISYAEGPALLLLSAALLLLHRRRYLATALLLVLLGLTRPVALPFVAVVAAHALARWRSADRPGRDEAAQLAVLFGASLAAALLWPIVAGLERGLLTGYLEIQQAWGMNASALEVATAAGPVGVTVLVLGVVVLVLVPLRPASAGWGPELRAWTACYPAYVLAVAPAAISLPRLLLLAAPLLWPLPRPASTRGGSRRRAALVLLLAAGGLGLQWIWVSQFLVIGPIEEQFGMP